MGTWIAATAHPSQNLLGRVANRRFACSRQAAAEWFYGTREYQLVPNMFDVERFTFDEEVRSQTRASLGLDPGTVATRTRGSLRCGRRTTSWTSSSSRSFGLVDAKSSSCSSGTENGAWPSRTYWGATVVDHVRFLGIRTDMPELLQAADLMLLLLPLRGPALRRPRGSGRRNRRSSRRTGLARPPRRRGGPVRRAGRAGGRGPMQRRPSSTRPAGSLERTCCSGASTTRPRAGPRCSAPCACPRRRREHSGSGGELRPERRSAPRRKCPEAAR